MIILTWDTIDFSINLESRYSSIINSIYGNFYNLESIIWTKYIYIYIIGKIQWRGEGTVRGRLSLGKFGERLRVGIMSGYGRCMLEMDFNESGGGGGGKGIAGGAKITAYVERCQPTMCNSNRSALTGKRSRYFSLLISRSATLLQSAVYLLSLEWCIDSSESGRFEDSPAWVHFIPLYLPFLSIEEQSYLLPYFSLDSWKFWKLVQSLFFPEILKIPICKFLEFLNNLLYTCELPESILV